MRVSTKGVRLPISLSKRDGWTEQLIELAVHIGVESALGLVERYGGQSIYISRRPRRPSVEDAIGTAAAERLRQVYTCERVALPNARYLLARRSRAAVVAQARAGSIGIAEAARAVGTSRTYMSHLVHHTNEGLEDDPVLRC